jgi:hypothetical protein
MRKYVLQRLLLAFITAFIILSLTYILVAALPIIGTFGKASSMFAYYQDQVRLGLSTSCRMRWARLSPERS